MGCLKKYETVQDILKEFFDLRLSYYGLRREWLVGMLGAESAKLNNQARFILEKIQGKITIENRSKKDLIQMLVQRGYESDPVKAWKEAQEKVIICRTRHSEKRLKATSKTTNPNPEI